MKILLDHCVPRPLAKVLGDFFVATARHEKMDQLQNGRLLAAAAAAGFNVLITTDHGFEHQQNIAAQPLAVILIKTHSNTPENLARFKVVLTRTIKACLPSSLYILGDVDITQANV